MNTEPAFKGGLINFDKAFNIRLTHKEKQRHSSFFAAYLNYLKQRRYNVNKKVDKRCVSSVFNKLNVLKQ